VSIYMGNKWPEINHAGLAVTVKRIEEKIYEILARQLSTDQSW